MPEIPEMEIYKTHLGRFVVGNSITKVAINRDKSINLPPGEFSSALLGKNVEEVKRRGKMLILILSDGNFLLSHMMLDGRLYLQGIGEEMADKDYGHICLTFADGQTLHFRDMRLGYVKWLSGDDLQKHLADLGVEPLSLEFTEEMLRVICEKRRGMIKPLLINQKVIAGIGNAYSNECLFAARIHPERRASTLSLDEVLRLHHSIPRILQEAIAAGGYLEEPFAQWDNLTGGMNQRFLIYDRKGKGCVTCGMIIEAKEVGGRWAYYCLNCQK